MDFLEFPLPPEPSVLFFFDLCDESFLKRMLGRIRPSLEAHPRELHLIYVAQNDAKERLLVSASRLVKLARNLEWNFCVYRAGSDHPISYRMVGSNQNAEVEQEPISVPVVIIGHG